MKKKAEILKLCKTCSQYCKQDLSIPSTRILECKNRIPIKKEMKKDENSDRQGNDIESNS